MNNKNYKKKKTHLLQEWDSFSIILPLFPKLETTTCLSS